MRVKGGSRFDVDFSDRNVVFGGGKLPGQVAAHALAGQPNHIGLPRGKPDLPDQGALEGNRFPLAVCDNHLSLFPGGLQGVEPDHPLSVCVGNRGLVLSGKANRHPSARLAPTPYGHFGIALENHVVGEGDRQLEFRKADRRAKKEQGSRGQGEKKFHDRASGVDLAVRRLEMGRGLGIGLLAFFPNGFPKSFRLSKFIRPHTHVPGLLLRRQVEFLGILGGGIKLAHRKIDLGPAA